MPIQLLNHLSPTVQMNRIITTRLGGILCTDTKQTCWLKTNYWYSEEHQELWEILPNNWVSWINQWEDYFNSKEIEKAIGLLCRLKYHD